MPITLDQMKVGMQDKITQQIIDILIRRSQILELMPFDNCISPSSGSTLTYKYTQIKTPAKAAFRAINSDYTAQAAEIQDKSVDLKIFGGSFEIDRILMRAQGNKNGVAFQMEQQTKSVVNLFHNTLINGDKTTRNTEFDGLDKMLVGTATEFNKDKVIDLSTITNLKANADEFYEMLTKLINATGAQAILTNLDMKTKIQTVARLLGYKTSSETAFGRPVTTINDTVRIIDMENFYDGVATGKPIVPIGERNVGGSQTGITDIYAVRFGMDALHGITLDGTTGIAAYPPKLDTDGNAVKKGAVEMTAAIALKNTNAAGVLRNIKIGA